MWRARVCVLCRWRTSLPLQYHPDVIAMSIVDKAMHDFRLAFRVTFKPQPAALQILCHRSGYTFRASHKDMIGVY